MGTNYVFKRVEKKYQLNEEKYQSFLAQISPYVVSDIYGEYKICNIYFDTDNYDLISKSIEKPVYKEKFRLRSYGTPLEDDFVFLELKKKYKGEVFKRRIMLTLAEARDYLNNNEMPGGRTQITKEIDYFRDFYNPKPKVYLAYDRIAYVAKDNPEVRITFDKNVRYRTYDLLLSKGDYGERLTNEGMYLLEIKTLGTMPLWLVKALSQNKIYPDSFSKYGEVYKIIKNYNTKEKANV